MAEQTAIVTSADVTARLSTQAYARLFAKNGGATADTTFRDLCIAEANSEIRVLTRAAFPDGVYSTTDTLDVMIVGKAVDLGRFDGASTGPDDDGWWVTVWLDRGQKRLRLIEQLAERGARLFGSSETLPGMGTVKARNGSIVPWSAKVPGEIMSWPYWRQTLSTSPQNTHSVIRPLKATLDEIEAAGEQPSATFWTDVEDALRSLGHSLRASSDVGGSRAKAGRSSESEIRASLLRWDAAMDRTLETLRQGREGSEQT